MEEILIACGDVDLLRKIASDLPEGRYKPIATKSAGGIVAKLEKRDVKVAVVHEQLGDGSGVALCTELRKLASNPKILLLVTDKPPAEGPFDLSLKYPVPGPVFRNALNRMAPEERSEQDLQKWKAFYQELGTRLEQLDTQSYYQMLGVPPNARHDSIVAAYDAASVRFHPDRYNQFRSERWGEALYQRANDLFKQITEAYSILSDRRLKKKYDQALSEGRLRLNSDEKSGQDAGPDLLENHAQTAQGKKFLRLAQRDLARNDWAAALQNLRFAASMEGDLPVIAQNIALCESKLKS